MVNSATLLEVLLTKKLTLAKSMLPQKTKPKPKDEDEEMNTFEIDKIQSLDCKFPTYFVDGTCHLDNFYFINNISNSIFVFTRNSKYCTTLKSDKIYCRITYDYCDDSFWAYSEKQKNILFKLDKHMNIIDKLQINICKIQNDFIKSLEYNKSNDSILLNLNLKQ